MNKDFIFEKYYLIYDLVELKDKYLSSLGKSVTDNETFTEYCRIEDLLNKTIKEVKENETKRFEIL